MKDSVANTIAKTFSGMQDMLFQQVRIHFTDLKSDITAFSQRLVNEVENFDE
jgi:hypothetical protein